MWVQCAPFYLLLPIVKVCLSSHLIHAVLLNTIFPSEPFRCIFLGRVLLHLCYIVATQSHLDSRDTSVQTKRTQFKEMVGTESRVKRSRSK